MNFKIKDLSVSERPREKLVHSGVEVLSDAELLSIILGHGGIDTSALNLAHELLKKFADIYFLHNAHLIELTNTKNIGIAKACSIKAAFELGIRVCNFASRSTTKIEKPQDLFELVKDKIYGKQKEHLYLVSLNARNIVITCDLVSIGTVNETLVSPREIYRHALQTNACSIALVHNHPSNDSNPSDDDIKLTKLIANLGKQLGIVLLDHLVISDKSYTSIKTLIN